METTLIARRRLNVGEKRDEHKYLLDSEGKARVDDEGNKIKNPNYGEMVPDYREIGEEVPEAASWPNLQVYVSSGQIEPCVRDEDGELHSLFLGQDVHVLPNGRLESARQVAAGVPANVQPANAGLTPEQIAENATEDGKTGSEGDDEGDDTGAGGNGPDDASAELSVVADMSVRELGEWLEAHEGDKELIKAVLDQENNSEKPRKTAVQMIESYLESE